MGRKEILMVSVGVIILLVVLVLLFYRKSYFFDYSIEDIKKVYITNGSNGEVVEVHKEEIQKIAELVKQIEMVDGEETDSTGWAYNIKISDDKKEYNITLISDDSIVVDNRRYEIKNETGKEIFEICKAFFNILYKNIDITKLSVCQAANAIITDAELL